MYSGDNAAYVVMPPETDATNASHTFSFDCKGFEAANILVGMNTHATNKAALTACKITEGDTTTAYAAIVAFTGGTATSSSVGFVIPSAVKMGGGGVMEFQVDLKARKRYLKVTPQGTRLQMKLMQSPDCPGPMSRGMLRPAVRPRPISM
jgi:hypothetical protein